MTQLPAPLSHDLELEAAALAHAQAQVDRSFVSRSRALGAGIEAQWARLPARLKAEVEAQVGHALRAGLGIARAAPQLGRRGQRWAVIASGAAGGAVGLAGALAEMPVALMLFLQAIRQEARDAGLDPDRPGVRLATLDILASGRAVAASEALDPAFVSGRLALAGPTLSGWIARAAPRLVPVLGQRFAASAVPLVGALGGAVLNAAWLDQYRRLARIRFRLMVLAEHHGTEAVLSAFARAQALPMRD
ncbi:staphylolytic protease PREPROENZYME LASA [bacterium]|nr:staphylolytic protease PREPROENZYME LASA [bacterium]